MELWNGYEKITDTYLGREVICVKPQNAAPGNPWVWRAEFFGAFASADLLMLERGWHVAYYRLSNLYGCPEAVNGMAEFYRYAVDTLSLSPYPALFGFSRGGLYTVNYALKYPETLSAVYLDAPVTDIRSWPGKSREHRKEWEDCMRLYGLTEQTSVFFNRNPNDNAEAFAALGIPFILVAGLADELVPYAENGEIFLKKYEAAGGKAKVILKENCGHHPHSLEDATEIACFLENAFQRKLSCL